jgi:hypothetical protein
MIFKLSSLRGLEIQARTVALCGHRHLGHRACVRDREVDSLESENRL